MSHKNLAKNAMCVFDFTGPEDKNNKNDIIKWCRENCKKWAFQLEEGKGGYKHFQGRVSFKSKTRAPTKLSVGMVFNWSLTSEENRTNNFYVVKKDSRLDGPWLDTDEEIYIPRQFRIEQWRPWQQTIIDRYDEWDPNCINMVYDPDGWLGKSTISGYLGSSGIGLEVPSELCMKDPKDVMQYVYGFPNKRIYLFDIPRADHHTQRMWRTIESLKKGYVYDIRNRAKRRYMDSPNIWVFSNTMPNPAMLTTRRWKVWEISDDQTFAAVSIDTCNNIYITERNIYLQNLAHPAQTQDQLGNQGDSPRHNGGTGPEQLDYDDYLGYGG